MTLNGLENDHMQKVSDVILMLCLDSGNLNQFIEEIHKTIDDQAMKLNQRMKEPLQRYKEEGEKVKELIEDMDGGDSRD